MISDPIPLKDSRSWRLGPVRVRHDFRDGWELDVKNWRKIVQFSRPRLSLSLCQFSDGDRHGRFSLDLFGAWIKLPVKPKRDVKEPPLDKWGFSLFERSLHLNWANKTKIVWMPWDFDHIDEKYEALMADGRWRMMPKWGKAVLSPDAQLSERYGPRWKHDYPYKYMLSSGEVQRRVATVTVERRVWRRRFVPVWMPILQKKTTSIDVRFDGELGDRTGSWKGGTIGCGYEMRPGEAPIDTLRRMERERKFR